MLARYREAGLTGFDIQYKEETNGRTRVRKIHTFARGMNSNRDFRVHNPDFDTLMRAILERVFTVTTALGWDIPPKPTRHAFQEHCGYFRDVLVHRLKSANLSPISTEQFVDLYTGGKRAKYERARLSLQEKSIQRSDSYISAFVKAEKVNFTLKPDPAPRVIQPRSPRFNILLGTFIKPLEEVLYHAIDHTFGYKVVVKGMNANSRGKLVYEHWCALGDAVAVILDAKRFDQHVSLPALLYEHSIYEDVFPSNLLRLLLRWQRNNRGFGRTAEGTIIYKVKGCRMSGDMNTSLGNVLLMCAMMYSYLRSCNVTKYRFINDGDDCILMMERGDLARLTNLRQWFLNLGFNMVMDDPVDVIERIDFCKARPVYNGRHYVMMRDPRDTLAKDLVSVKSIVNERSWKVQRRSIALCGLSLAGDLPIKYEYYMCLLRGTDESHIDNDERMTGMDYLAVGMKCKYRTPTDDCRASFHRAFGYTPASQRCIEQMYRDMELVWREPELASGLYWPTALWAALTDDI